MATAFVPCPRCQRPVAASERYCPACGAAIAPALVRRLQDLYALLRQLDERTNAGWSERTVAELREDALREYLALHAARTQTLAPAAAAAPEAQSTSADTYAPPAFASSSASPAVPAGPEPAAMPAVPVTPAPAAPSGPAFSWRAFVAEQAIALMAYLGGFLLLVATLVFEVGGWQDLPNQIKLAAVVGVYVVFGALGFVLRRSEHLRTVGRAYLGVFALMTPLVALAVYRFALQAAGFPVAGMLCVASAYAAVIYLMLAQRTAFIAYAYLGWSALALAVLALVPWTAAPSEWYLVALAGASIALLVSKLLAPRLRLALLAAPALHLAVLTSLAAALGTLIVGGTEATSASQSASTVQAFPAPAFTLACAGVAVAGFFWERLARAGLLRAMGILPETGDALDVIATGYAVATAVVAAVWAGADRQGIAYVLAALALVILGRAAVLRRLPATNAGLRYTLEGMAAALAAVGAATVLGDPAPNTPLLAALSAGVVVTLVSALLEDEPWIVLAAGLFLSLDYHAFVLALASWTGADQHFADMAEAALGLSNYTLGLVAALWLVGLALGFGRQRRYAWPVLLVALGNALFDLLLLLPQPATYSVPVLTALALAALIAGRRERQPVWTGFTASLFGMLAALAVALSTRAPLPLFLAALVPAALALGVRRWLGRAYAYAPYVVTLWATMLSSAALELSGQSQAVPLGLHLAPWLLLAVAAAGIAAALMEREPWTMIVPATLALAAISLYRAFTLFTLFGVYRFRPEAPVTTVALVVLFAGVGVALRQYRGAGWSVPWHAAAALGALIAAYRVGTLPNGPTWQVFTLLGFAALAYLVALHERQPWATAATAVYALLAAAAIPSPNSLLPTLAITFGAALVGGALRLRLGRDWSLALYAAGAGASIMAIARISHYDAGTAEVLLLLFAALAYGLASLERSGQAQAIGNIAPALYAAAAALAQPDAHVLLPLALALGMAGAGVSRLSGLRWGWPFYAAAATAALYTAITGTGEPGFEALALLAFALLAYAVAAVDSRPEVLPLVLLLAVLALATEIGAARAHPWLGTLAFGTLGWLFYAGAALWQRIPWLRAATTAWWTSGLEDRERAARLSEPRTAGVLMHRWGGLAVATGTPIGAALAADALAPHAAVTQAGALALFSLAALLALHDRLTATRVLRYVAGALAALALSWEARWLGTGNVQAFVLAPGSYLIVAGTLMSGDTRLGRVARLGYQCMLAGMLLLLLPTLAQSFVEDAAWIYTLLLTVEALALAGYGVGSRSRALVLTGSLFVGIAALRGAALAVNSGVPVALVIALLALLLMGLATWLSLRARREATAS